jgi:hypothetical protein
MHSCTRFHIGIGLFIIPLRLNSPQPVEAKIPPSGLGGASLKKNSLTGSSPQWSKHCLDRDEHFPYYILNCHGGPRALAMEKIT